MEEQLEKIKDERERWYRQRIEKKGIKVLPRFNPARIPIELLYTPLDIKSFLENIGFPGEYPYTRGIHPTMYRTNLWTIREYAGFGTAAETNQRFKFLLNEGQTGLSMALDLPTQIGYDSGDGLVEDEEIGRIGVAIDTLKDMELIYDGIPLERVSTNFTINSTAAPIFAMYLAVADKQGVPYDKVRGTLQNEVLKEYVARGTWIFPPEPSMRLSLDIIEYSVKEVPQFYPVSLTSAHMREAGASSVQSLGYLFEIAINYAERLIARGIPIDAFAPRFSFSLGTTLIDFFEEIAKYRAGRRIWARLMRERFQAKDPRSWMCRFFAGCGGSSLVAEEPENNIIRIAYEALATVLGGAQAIHTCSFDEPIAIPTEDSVRIALRTQQILAYETGVTDTVDPLGGSYYVEALTDRMEEEILKEMKKIEDMGGMIAAIEKGYVQGEISKRAYEIERKIASGELVLVGRNKFATKERKTKKVTFFKLDPETARKQKENLSQVKKKRNYTKVAESLAELKRVAESKANIMPIMIEAVKAYCSIGEITSTLKDVFGEYREQTLIN
ncbi:MAG: methylmalonyl-CoA mutase [Deltaproteobacteria bacterium]|nr:methylmalonyl-CoA mutase [Deltaproteobacteria bacterium]